jgi:metal-responsive CopG/Arc/MetJ family transcriptional regulator
VKTAVSIPDPIFEAADRLARRRRVSRSALYAEALELLLATDTDDAAITERLDAVYAEQGGGLDPAIAIVNATVLREQW